MSRDNVFKSFAKQTIFDLRGVSDRIETLKARLWEKYIGVFPKINKRKGERGKVDVFGKRAPHIPERASRNVLFTVGRPWKARQPCPAFYSKSVNLLLSNFHIATPHPSTYAHGFACTEECGAACQLLRRRLYRPQTLYCLSVYQRQRSLKKCCLVTKV